MLGLNVAIRSYLKFAFFWESHVLCGFILLKLGFVHAIWVFIPVISGFVKSGNGNPCLDIYLWRQTITNVTALLIPIALYKSDDCTSGR